MSKDLSNYGYRDDGSVAVFDDLGTLTLEEQASLNDAPDEHEEAQDGTEE